MAPREKGENRRHSYSSISIPTRLIKEIGKMVRELGYWPTKTAFIREACLEKLERYRRELEARRLVEKAERTRVT